MVGTLTLAHTREELADALSTAGGRIGFVPTMGEIGRASCRERV